MFKNSPRTADVFVSVVCLFDTPMSRPQLADCSRSDHSSPTPAGAMPLSNGTDLRPSSSPPSLPHLPIYAHPALYDSHRAPPPKSPAKQCRVDLFFSTLPLCHLLIFPERHDALILVLTPPWSNSFMSCDSPTFFPPHHIPLSPLPPPSQLVFFVPFSLALHRLCVLSCLTVMPDRGGRARMFVRVHVLSNNSQGLISMSKPLCLPSEQSAQRLVAFCPSILPAPQKEQRGGRSEGRHVCACGCVSWSF